MFLQLAVLYKICVGESRELILKQSFYLQNSAYESSDIFMVLSSEHGLICYGANQTDGNCEDYRVRFYCPSKGTNNLMQFWNQNIDWWCIFYKKAA